MELCRRIKDALELRKVLSWSSPETAEIFRPRSTRKEQPSASNEPKDPTAGLENVHSDEGLVLGCFANFRRFAPQCSIIPERNIED